MQWKYYTALHSLRLLLGNLSLFIIGITLFIANKNIRKAQSDRTEIDMSTIGTLGGEENGENQGNSNMPSSSENVDSIKNEEQSDQSIENEVNINQNTDSIENAGSSSIDNIIIDSAIIENEVDGTETQNVMEQNAIEVGVINDNISKTDIWILSISVVFLLLTIIFSIIYIKHQQKPKKKVSK